MFRRQLFAAIAGVALIVAGTSALAAQTVPGADPAQAPARVSIVHLAPFSAESTAVTVTLNGSPLPGTFEYKDPATPYQSVPAGEYAVAIYAGTDTTAEPVLTAAVTLGDGQDYTVLAVGDKVGDGPGNIPLQLLVLEDDNAAPEAGSFKLRIVHAAPFGPQEATGVDVVLEDGTPIPGLQDIPFGSVSPYLELPAGVPVDVKVLATGTTTEIFNPGPVTANDGDIYTAVAIGGANGAQPELFLIQHNEPAQDDDTVYLPFLANGDLPSPQPTQTASVTTTAGTATTTATAGTTTPTTTAETVTTTAETITVTSGTTTPTAATVTTTAGTITATPTEGTTTPTTTAATETTTPTTESPTVTGTAPTTTSTPTPTPAG